MSLQNTKNAQKSVKVLFKKIYVNAKYSFLHYPSMPLEKLP